MSQTKEWTTKTKDKLSNEHLLLDASDNGDLKTVRDLLSLPHINVNYQNHHNNTALTLAARHGHLKIVKALLAYKRIDKRIDVNKIGDLDECSALILAAREGHIEIVKALLKEPDIKVNVVNVYERSALGEAAIEGHVEIVQALLAEDANINDKLLIRLNQLIRADQNNQNLQTIRDLILKKYITPRTKKNSKHTGAGTRAERRLRKRRRTRRKPTNGKHY